MTTHSDIIEHIDRLPDNAIFSTRDVIRYGTRNAVDLSMFKLVKLGDVIRLARGIFVRARGLTRSFSLREIAEAKARAFGKELFADYRDAARLAGLMPRGRGAPVYLVNGSSSSFLAGNVEVFLRRGAPRKLAIEDNNAGIGVRALWSIGPEVTTEQIERVRAAMRLPELMAFIEKVGFLPAWLTDKLSPQMRGAPFHRKSTGDGLLVHEEAARYSVHNSDSSSYLFPENLAA